MNIDFLFYKFSLCLSNMLGEGFLPTLLHALVIPAQPYRWGEGFLEY